MQCDSLITLNRLSWRTRLMAASSPDGESFVWKTTPKDPFPTILHWVYCISRVSPVTPSWTFSRMTSGVQHKSAGAQHVCEQGGVPHLPFSSSRKPLAYFATSWSQNRFYFTRYVVGWRWETCWGQLIEWTRVSYWATVVEQVEKRPIRCAKFGWSSVTWCWGMW